MSRLEAEARGFGLSIAEVNGKKPWGGYLRFCNCSLQAFLNAYWSGVIPKLPKGNASVDPKVLLVAPNAKQGNSARLKMLSVQWHRRRSELWHVIDGPVLFFAGHGWNDLTGHVKETGDVIRIPQGQWHCLIGLKSWGRVAELWVHSDPQKHPSDEDDIVREYDNYGRYINGPKKPGGKNVITLAEADRRKKKWKEAYDRWWLAHGHTARAVATK
ncbi:MAG TPA: hypothetical protein QF564_25850 [Pirellulaceae bacterium]|jgi:mannose-6-phosphate isomerase-like protein (cupin superfamily)|nr:hypothetical protein [Pirellulaceae bacterium]